MNDITYAVSIDVNNPIIPYNVYVASVLDSNVRYLEITLYQNGNVIALSNTATATASLVTDNVLVNDSVNCTISDSIITVPLEDLQRHGNLDVQVTVTEGTKVLAIPFPIQVRVTPNIAENAQIDGNSLGSYAEVVQEIAEARNGYDSLDERLNSDASGMEAVINKVQSIGSQSQTGDNDKYPSVTAVRNYVNIKTDDLKVYIDNEFDGLDEAKADKTDTNAQFERLIAVLQRKADSAETLAGYGINDAYTKAEVTALNSAKVDKADYAEVVQEIAEEVGDLKSAVNNKLDAPLKTGAVGQVLLNDGTSNRPFWSSIPNTQAVNLHNIIENGNFINGDGWVAYGLNNLQAADGEASLINPNNAKPYFVSKNYANAVISNKRYFLSMEFNVNTDNFTAVAVSIYRSGAVSSPMIGISSTSKNAGWRKIAGIITIPPEYTEDQVIWLRVGIQYNPVEENQVLTVKNLMLIPIDDFSFLGIVDAENVDFFLTKYNIFYVDGTQTILVDSADIRNAGVNDIVILGDSVMANYSVPTLIQRATRMTTINCAIGGTRMGTHQYPSYDSLSFYKIAESISTGDFSDQITAASTLGNVAINHINALSSVDWSKVKYLVISFGTNDWISSNTPTGNGFSSVAYSLSYGAKLIANTYPLIKIIICTPIFRSAYGTKEGEYSDTYEYNGFTLIDFVNAIENECKTLKEMCINNYFNLGINSETASTFLVDGTHPTDYGCERIAKRIYNKIMYDC